MYHFFFNFSIEKVKNQKKRGGGGRKKKVENMEQLQMLMEISAKVLDTTPEKIMGKERYRKTVVARQIYSYLSRTIFDYGLVEIGKSINKDHTTIIHSIRHVKKMLEINDPIISEPYQKIMGELKTKMKKEIKVSILINDLIDPNIILHDMMSRYDCIISPIY